MALLPPLSRAELAALGIACISGGDQTEETRFVPGAKKDRKIPSAGRLSRHPIVSLSLAKDERVAKDDLVHLYFPRAKAPTV